MRVAGWFEPRTVRDPHRCRGHRQGSRHTPVDNFSGAVAIIATLSTMANSIKHAFARLIHEDDGDVPGWVLITLMTAGLVIIIWGLAGPALSAVFQQAIQRVTGF